MGPGLGAKVTEADTARAEMAEEMAVVRPRAGTAVAEMGRPSVAGMAVEGMVREREEVVWVAQAVREQGGVETEVVETAREFTAGVAELVVGRGLEAEWGADQDSGWGANQLTKKLSRS